VLRGCFFPPHGGRREEWAGAYRTNMQLYHSILVNALLGREFGNG
jgi:hypothetical protein